MLQGCTCSGDDGPGTRPAQSQGASHLALLAPFREGTQAFAACEFGVAPAELVGLLAQGHVLTLVVGLWIKLFSLPWYFTTPSVVNHRGQLPWEIMGCPKSTVICRIHAVLQDPRDGADGLQRLKDHLQPGAPLAAITRKQNSSEDRKRTV